MSRKSIAVFSLQGLGNSLLALPVLMSLKNEFTVVAYVRDPGCRELFFRLGIHCYIVSSKWKLLKQKVARTDVATALWIHGLRELYLLMRSPAVEKWSFVSAEYPRTRLGIGRKIEARAAHDLENNFQLLEQLGMTPIYPNVASGIRHALGNANVGLRASLHPTASSRGKYYEPEFWSSLIKWLWCQGFQIDMFCGASTDQEQYCRKLIVDCGLRSGIDLHVGKPLCDVARLIAGSKVFIGADSALMHLAALSDVFTVGLWSFASLRRIHPYGNNVHVYVAREVAVRGVDQCKRAPSYVRRADWRHVARIVSQEARPVTSIEPRFVSAVRLYTY